MINVSNPKKIAVLRANVLGDFIFVLPALQALRERFPEAEIVLLGKAWHRDFLKERPSPVDRVIVVPPYPGVGEEEDFVPDMTVVDAFFEEVRKEQFDIAFQLHGGGQNSNPFLLRLGAKMTVGLRTPNAPELDISVPYLYYFSETLRYLDVVRTVGARTAEIEPFVQVMPSDIEEARKVIGFPDKPVAVIHPGASDARRRWAPENFAFVADFLAEQGFQVFVTGTRVEKEENIQVLQNVRHKDQVSSLLNKLNLSGLTGLLAIANLVVSNDTGPLHLARALSTPTIGIYWLSNLITGMPMSTAGHQSLISFTTHCPVCNKPVTVSKDITLCEHKVSLVFDIKRDSVITAIRELLSTGIRKHELENSSEAA